MSIARAPLPLYQLIEDASSASLRQINHLLPMWFWETDADYVVTYCSENIDRLTGVTAEQLVGVCILNPLYGRGESEAGLADYHDALRKRQPIESFSYERILLSGQRVVLLDSAIPQFDEDGAFSGYCGISFHLSEALRVADINGSLMVSLKNRADQLEEALSQRNEELATSNRLLAEVFDALGEGLMVTQTSDLTDPSNKVLWVNPAFRNLWGLGEHEVYAGLSVLDVHNTIADRGDIPREDLAAFSSRLGQRKLVELTLSSNGTSLEVKGIPRPDGGMVMVFTDVTKLRAHTSMLERAKRDAEAANQAKSNFLASMSHEIRTPMNGIVGVADLLQGTDLDADQAEFVDTIRSSALSLTSLISDILDFSKIEAGHLALHLAPFDMQGLMDDMRRMMSAMTQVKGIELHVTMASDHPRMVVGDQERLRQVLINLLGNAIKFTPVGHVSMTVSKAERGRTVIDVEDTGVGIPEADLQGIFNSFEQVQSGFHREFEGTGLGLAISKELVSAMGGEIGVISTVGAGSVFRITLPLPVANAVSSLVPIAPETQVEPVDLAGYSVLLAEDNQTNQFVAKKMLQRLGIVPTVVSNGQAACDAVQASNFDLILMDVSMPVLSGLEASRAIRELEEAEGRARCAIIALTGNAFESDRQNCLNAGMDGFMTKPVRLAELTSCLQEFCQRSGTAR